MSADLTPGDGVVYRPRPDAPGEDGEVVRVTDRGTVMVRYLNGPQAGKVCATSPRDLTRSGGAR